MNKLKSIAKVIFAIIIIVFIVVAPFVLIPAILDDQPISQNNSVKGILEMWHIETFEGGSRSRVDWLNARAKIFERKNVGVYLHITTLTAEQAEAKIANGETFDLVSFGVGCGESFVDLLGVINNTGNTRACFNKGGQYKGRQLAIPYMVGGYALIALEGSVDSGELLPKVFDYSHYVKYYKSSRYVYSVSCGFGVANQPLVALSHNCDVAPKDSAAVGFDQSRTQYEAYEGFLRGESVILLGSQRDVYRLGNRENNGSIGKLCVTPLAGYTDLIQYLAYSDLTDEELLPYALGFIDYLTSKPCQEQLVGLNMLSASGISLYQDNNYMKLLELALADEVDTLNVFTTADKITLLRQASYDKVVKGEKNQWELFFG